MTNKLSERIASGENTPELDEAIARAMGWQLHGCNEAIDWIYLWKREGDAHRGNCPSYRTDIRLTLAEIERQGWLSSHTATRNDGCEFDVFNGEWCQTSERPDRNLGLAALEALLKAMGE
jgi:hypothetical protein